MACAHERLSAGTQVTGPERKVMDREEQLDEPPVTDSTFQRVLIAEQAAKIEQLTQDLQTKNKIICMLLQHMLTSAASSQPVQLPAAMLVPQQPDSLPLPQHQKSPQHILKGPSIPQYTPEAAAAAAAAHDDRHAPPMLNFSNNKRSRHLLDLSNGGLDVQDPQDALHLPGSYERSRRLTELNNFQMPASPLAAPAASPPAAAAGGNHNHLLLQPLLGHQHSSGGSSSCSAHGGHAVGQSVRPHGVIQPAEPEFSDEFEDGFGEEQGDKAAHDAEDAAAVLAGLRHPSYQAYQQCNSGMAAATAAAAAGLMFNKAAAASAAIHQGLFGPQQLPCNNNNNSSRAPADIMEMDHSAAAAAAAAQIGPFSPFGAGAFDSSQAFFMPSQQINGPGQDAGVVNFTMGRRPAGASARGKASKRSVCYADKSEFFQDEVRVKIADSVKAAIRQDWVYDNFQVGVSCNAHTGTFCWNPSTGSFWVKMAGKCMTPNEFEAAAGKKSSRNWQLSCTVPRYCTKTNKPIKLGHFVRIVGIDTATK